MKKIVVLISGSGTNLEAIAKACNNEIIPGSKLESKRAPDLSTNGSQNGAGFGPKSDPEMVPKVDRNCTQK